MLALLPMDGAHSRTLQAALEIVASKEKLANALGISHGDVDAYLSGEKPLPQPAFLRALDIVAAGRDRGSRTISSGRNADTVTFGTSTTLETRRSTATLHMM